MGKGAVMDVVVKTRDAERTREAILRAAQTAFAQRGYAAVGVRDITGAAEVNASLVNRYFGSKERLFEEALADLLDTRLLTDVPRTGYGAAVMRTFTADTGGRVNPLPILVLATADPVSREIADRLLRSLVMEPLVRWFNRADAEERAARMVMLASGFFTYRLLYPLEPLTGTLTPGARGWLEAQFQALVEEVA
jgi:AcrR family transcriptional regulator